MTDAFERLRKILNLERQQGYRNKAVIGGLDKFASRWEPDARSEAPHALETVQDIVSLLIGYPTVEDREARARIIADILSRLQSILGDTQAQSAPLAQPAPPPKPPPASGSPPSPKPRRPVSRAVPSAAIVTAGGLDAPVDRLPNVGPRYRALLAKLGVQTVRDLLWLFPRRYDDYTVMKTIDRLEHGEQVTIMGRVWDVRTRKVRGNRAVVEAVIGDATGSIQVTWFSPYMAQQIKPGRILVLSGKIDLYLGRLTMRHPSWEPFDKELIHTGRLVPVYPLIEGLQARWLRKLMRQVVTAWAPRITDSLPPEVRERAGLLPLGEALEQIHFPSDQETLAAARRRLAFDEFFLIQLGLLRQRQNWRSQPGRVLRGPWESIKLFRSALPFQLTRAQNRALREIVRDMRREKPMARLLQGDVGSGKTVIAAAVMWLAVCSGVQAALMAPTEILAEQHYQSFRDLFSRLDPALAESTAPSLARMRARIAPSDAPPEKADVSAEPRSVRLALLIGSMSLAEKEKVKTAIATGDVDIVVGTHALIQEGVAFRNLGLVVVDEQHRFGVTQRARLKEKGIVPASGNGMDDQQKGRTPHTLVMTATPIPRTLALTLYGDMDLSVIDELPPGRRPIKTYVRPPTERERIYAFIRHQVEQGRQAFIIYPLVEESEHWEETKAAIDDYERLSKEIFPDLRLGLLHGRMKGQEKDAVMMAFKRGELDILVATAVVEVGIDVPNATVMLIEGAEHFGLAQLHQFRGRVGRGVYESYCILLPSKSELVGSERLQAMRKTQDGFRLAEIDLRLRGPGEFLGTRQSGIPELKVAQLGDVRTLELARQEAQALFKADPELQRPEHQALAAQLDRFWCSRGDLS
ncbi:MAG TPA: ATP-dependent DNA helicase RecG [Anaerolineae bacterium]|nr:ATP-dependent DNA helicase RecG [Anaerolineae bacterium]